MTKTTVMPESIVAVTLSTRNIEGQRRFYEAWGWSAVPYSNDEYVAFSLGAPTLAFDLAHKLGEEAVARPLPDGAKGSEWPVGRDARLLAEFPLGRRERILAGFDETLGNGPGVLILLAPEWAAGVREQHTQPFRRALEEQQAGARILAARRRFGHFFFGHTCA